MGLNYYLENKLWRRERDSNPRRRCRLNGFQVRRFQPLTHPSTCDHSLKNVVISQVRI